MKICELLLKDYNMLASSNTQLGLPSLQPGLPRGEGRGGNLTFLGLCKNSAEKLSIIIITLLRGILAPIWVLAPRPLVSSWTLTLSLLKTVQNCLPCYFTTVYYNASWFYLSRELPPGGKGLRTVIVYSKLMNVNCTCYCTNDYIFLLLVHYLKRKKSR